MKNIFLGLLFLIFVVPISSGAFSISNIPNTPIEGSFKMVGTSKINISSIKPGESSNAVIRILNQSGSSANFFVGKEIDDRMPNEYGKDFLEFVKVDKDSFVLKHGEQAEIGLSVTIPSNFSGQNEFGGIVFVSSQKTEDAGGGGTKVLVRLPSIISVKVDGDKNNINTSVFGGKTNSSNVFLYIVFGIFVIILSLYFFKKWLR